MAAPLKHNAPGQVYRTPGLIPQTDRGYEITRPGPTGRPFGLFGTLTGHLTVDGRFLFPAAQGFGTLTWGSGTGDGGQGHGDPGTDPTGIWDSGQGYRDFGRFL